MFHFIKEGDIVPAACFVETAWNNFRMYFKLSLEAFAKGLTDKFVDDAVDGMKKAATSSEDKEDIDSIVSKAKDIVNDAFWNKADFKYAPIGCYIIDQDQGSKDPTLKDSWVELKENVEETLKNALKIFSKFSWLPSTDKEIAKELGEKHSLATYESLLL